MNLASWLVGPPRSSITTREVAPTTVTRKKSASDEPSPCAK